MSRQKLFIESLTDTEKITLEQGYKNASSIELRERCHAVLLSQKRYSVQQLAEVFSKTENTIRTWLNNWKKYGISGIISKPGRGDKPRLSLDNQKHVKVVEKAVKNAAKNGTNMLEEVNRELDLEKPICKATLNRFLIKKTIVTRGFVNGRKSKLTRHKFDNS